MQPTSPSTPDPGHPQEYAFIMNPAQPQRQRLLPGGNSRLVRLIFALVGICVLLIIDGIIKGALSSSSNVPALINVAQDQHELVHLATNATQQTGLTTSNQNFAVTAQASLTSAQSDLLIYLKKNGTKVSSKQLALKVSTTVDEQLTTAATASTYNATFKEVMQTKLTAYQTALKQAYTKTKGPKGRTLLSKDYDAASLLLQQLNTPST